jgi:hypothetical protein
VNTPASAIAVIDGALCLVSRHGTRTVGHAPLATAVVEFLHRPFHTYVREHPFGLLPGLPNLYCLDGDFRLQWMAEWPDPTDPCVEIIEEDGETVTVLAASGAVVRLSAHDGRLLSYRRSMAATA